MQHSCFNIANLIKICVLFVVIPCSIRAENLFSTSITSASTTTVIASSKYSTKFKKERPKGKILINNIALLYVLLFYPKLLSPHLLLN